MKHAFAWEYDMHFFLSFVKMCFQNVFVAIFLVKKNVLTFSVLDIPIYRICACIILLFYTYMFVWLN